MTNVLLHIGCYILYGKTFSVSHLGLFAKFSRLSECKGNLFTVLITSVSGDCKSPLHAMSVINEYKLFIFSRTVGAIFNRPNH